eukprot:6287166-Amphidinium_carterae.1
MWRRHVDLRTAAAQHAGWRAPGQAGPRDPHPRQCDRGPGQAGLCCRCGWRVDPGRAGWHSHCQKESAVSSLGQPACDDVPYAVALCGGGGCRHGHRYTTRHGRTFASTSSSWHQA